MWPFFARQRENGGEHRDRVSQGALLLDVRSHEEFLRGHIEGAVNIPVQDLPARMSELGTPEREIVVYCRSGARSASAARFLKQAGYRVKDIGPMSAW